MSLRISRIAIALSVTLAAAAAEAKVVAGVNLPDTVNVNGQTLLLNGAGIRKKFFVKVYVGGLYLASKQGNAAAILASDSVRRMVMHFVYSVDKGKIAEGWEEGLRDNTPNASAEVKSNFKTLASWMEDIEKGHEIVLTYVPGTGTTVEANGKLKGTFPGKATADAIAATWIGPKPGPGEDFRKGVLGQ